MIWGCHSGEYKDGRLHGCSTVWTGITLPTFQKSSIIRVMSLMMELVWTSETLVNLQHTMWRYNPESSHLNMWCYLCDPYVASALHWTGLQFVFLDMLILYFALICRFWDLQSLLLGACVVKKSWKCACYLHRVCLPTYNNLVSQQIFLNLILWSFTKICWHVQILVKIRWQ
jgi:hypothetical protein